jgi:hypothetical protein
MDNNTNQVLSDFIRSNSKKKSLNEILKSQICDKPISDTDTKKLKAEFSKIKDEINGVENSYLALMEIQEKLSTAFDEITKKENEKV